MKKKYSEESVIGNLKAQFVKKSLHSQIHTSIRPSIVNGNIALAYYRGLNVGREEAIEDVLRALKKKFPEAVKLIKDL